LDGRRVEIGRVAQPAPLCAMTGGTMLFKELVTGRSGPLIPCEWVS